ncbi:MAG TPA: ribosomal protein S18-alanine N-acetyltransferase [Terriglobales bacterium]|nr:ribosomal protein S18-alanine N-acetyltransferase [Terriglobales bacterium]
MTTAPQIRAARPDDTPAILSIEQRTSSAAHWPREEYEWVFTSDAPRRLILVAEENSGTNAASITGFLVAREVSGQWEIENVVVDVAKRGRGLGDRLLREFIDRARLEGANLVCLEVRESNDVARRLYTKRGFVECGRRKSYYQNPSEDAVLYQRSLLSR